MDGFAHQLEPSTSICLDPARAAIAQRLHADALAGLRAAYAHSIWADLNDG